MTRRRSGEIMRDRPALTLIEVLCVIVIIVLLVALLMPSLGHSRALSTRLICSTHLRAYGQFGQAWLNDNDNAFPDARQWLYSSASDTDAHPMGCRWHDRTMSLDGDIMSKSPQYRGKMWEYTASLQVAPCPVFRDIARKFGCENKNHRKDIDIDPQYNYTMNAYLGTEEPGGVLKLHQARSPSIVFFFAEENSWSLSYATKSLPAALSTKALDDQALTVSYTAEPRDCFATFHGATTEDMDNGSGNAVFLDGHVEEIKAPDQLPGQWSSQPQSSWQVRESNPGGNLYRAWAHKSPPPNGWDPVK
jgi:prepilin-type processing-associated H-X9-DG protein